MAAAESNISLAFHDITSGGEEERSHDFLTRFSGFLDEVLKRRLTVGKLYKAMVQVGLLWKRSDDIETKHERDLFAMLLKFV